MKKQKIKRVINTAMKKYYDRAERLKNILWMFLANEPACGKHMTAYNVRKQIRFIGFTSSIKKIKYTRVIFKAIDKLYSKNR